MVLNKHYASDSSAASDEDAWEMVGEDYGETDEEATPLVVTPTEHIPTAVPAAEQSEARSASEHIGTIEERESQLLESNDTVLNAETTDDGLVDGNASFVSGVSSITGDHHTVSEVDDEESLHNEEEHEEEHDRDVEDLVPDSEEAATTSTEPDLDDEEGAVMINAIEHLGAPLGTYATFDQNEFRSIFGSSVDLSDRNWFTVHQKNADGYIIWTGLVVTGPHSPDGMSWMRREPIVHGAFNHGDVLTPATDPLVEQLSQMGFEEKQITKTMGDLRRAGVTDIDADSVIGSMAGEETNVGSTPLSNTWDFVESTVQDIDRRHQLRDRTQRCMQHINRSVQDVWSNVRNESQQFRSNLGEVCDQADGHARNAATSVRYAASSAKESACRANEKHRITEKLATVAVVGGATLLALGNPRAGVGAIAVAGASLAAGEAMKQSSAGSTARGRDYGLNEDLHLD